MTGTERDASFTQTTGPSYFWSTLTAVWARDVVAPPISSGIVKPWRCISVATLTISSRLGVIRPGQPDRVGADLARGVEDLLRRHHHAEVDHLVVVALQHDADDVLADVVDVALHRRHHDRAVGVLLLWPASGSLAFSSSMNGMR